MAPDPLPDPQADHLAGLLNVATLPDAPVDTDEALRCATRAGRRRRARRHRTVSACAVLVVGLVGAVTWAHRNETPSGERVATEPAPDATTSPHLGWTSLPPVPGDGRDSGVAVWTGEEIIVVGGTSTAGCLPPVLCDISLDPLASGAAYNLATETWREIPDAPAAFVTGTALWTGSEALVFPAASSTAATPMFAYDPRTDQWRTPAQPSGRVSDAAMVDGVVLAVAPGDDGPQVQAYRSWLDEWDTLPPHPLGPLSEAQVVASGGDAVLLGSTYTDGAGDQPVNGFFQAAVWDGTAWTELPESELVNNGGEWAAVAPGIVANPQGFSGDAAYPDAGGVLDVGAMSWRPLPTGAPTTDPNQAPATDHRGETGRWAAGDGLLVDPVAEQWHEIEARPDGVVFGASAWTGEVLIVVGGLTGDDDGNSGLSSAVAAYQPPTPNCDGFGGVSDLAGEPEWERSNEYRRWSTTDGCPVRIDVIADSPGPEHCDNQAARRLMVGQPLGERFTDLPDSTTYLRDPTETYGAGAAEGLDLDADLPQGATDTGYRLGNVELWHLPGRPGAIWLKGPERTERWPAFELPGCR
jgi:hypothetical protein